MTAAQVTRDGFHAWEGDTHLYLKPSEAFEKASVGFVGASDGLTDLKDGKLDWTYASTGDQAGNTMMTGALPRLRQSSPDHARLRHRLRRQRG